MLKNLIKKETIDKIRPRETMMDKNKALKQIDLDIANLNIDEAIKKAQNSYKTFKDNCFLNKVVQIREKQGKLKEANETLKKMLKLEPNNNLLIEKIALNYFNIGDYKQCLNNYKKLLNKMPYSSKYNYCVGYAYHFLRDYKNAIKYYTFAIKINSKNLSAINNLGIIYYENNNPSYAKELYDNAISINPNHPEAYHHLGIIYREFLDDIELSILHLKKALRMDPNYPFNSYQLALSYKRANDKDNAIKYFKKTLELKPNYQEAIKELKGLED